MHSRIVDASHQTRKQTAVVTCPDCGAKIVVKGLIQIGRGVRCENCEAELEVVNLAPVQVDWASQEAKDNEGFLVRW